MTSVDDISALQHVTEEEILATLNTRFLKKQIYTDCGQVLIAVNPFQTIDIYSQSTVQAYIDNPQQLPPHVYAVAHNVYESLMQTREPQTCIMTGESGSGKTETAKYLINYFSTLLLPSAAETPLQNEAAAVNPFYAKLIESNPLLELFGNCATANNSNSSRFLKWLQIFVNVDAKHITRVNVQRFLLEQQRVTNRACDETNFHVFHHVAAALKHHPDLATKYNFNADTPCLIAPLGANHDPDSAIAHWQHMDESMAKVGLSPQDRERVFSILSALLQLGDLSFASAKQDEGSQVDSLDVLNRVSDLVGVPVPELETAFCTSSIKVGGEIIFRTNTVSVAETRRDMLITAIYQQLFDWLVQQVNQSLQHTATPTPTQVATHPDVPVGILDVFGFENFTQNHFEQLLINYCNERLFHYFHDVIVDHQVQLYESQGLVGYFDNLTLNHDTACLTLIENSSHANPGIFAMVDEEVFLPKGNDEALFNKMKKAISQANPKFNALRPRKNSTSNYFSVDHYAGKVTYKLANFLSKNTNHFANQLEHACVSSSNPFLKNCLFGKALFQATPSSAKRKTSAAKSLTVCSSFKRELSQLMRTMATTKPWFVSCIKPNRARKPMTFDPQFVLKQLEYTGISDLCRVRQNSFAVQMPVLAFESAFLALAKQRTPAKQLVEHLQETFPQHPFRWAVGTTIVFMQDDDLQFLQTQRDILLSRHAVHIQTMVRGRQARNAFCRYAALLTRLELAIQSFSSTVLPSPPEYQTIEATMCQTIAQLPQGAVNTHPVQAANQLLNHTEAALRDTIAQIVNRQVPIEMAAIERALEDAQIIRNVDVNPLLVIAKELRNVYQKLDDAIASENRLEEALRDAVSFGVPHTDPRLVQCQAMLKLVRDRRERGAAITLQAFWRAVCARLEVAAKRRAQVEAIEAERLAVIEAERLAVIEAERLAVIEAERLAVIEAERLAVIEAERLAAIETERLAAIESERLAAIESEHLAAIESERLAAAQTTEQPFTEDPLDVAVSHHSLTRASIPTCSTRRRPKATRHFRQATQEHPNPPEQVVAVPDKQDVEMDAARAGGGSAAASGENATKGNENTEPNVRRISFKDDSFKGDNNEAKTLFNCTSSSSIGSSDSNPAISLQTASTYSVSHKPHMSRSSFLSKQYGQRALVRIGDPSFDANNETCPENNRPKLTRIFNRDARRTHKAKKMIKAAQKKGGIVALMAAISEGSKHLPADCPELQDARYQVRRIQQNHSRQLLREAVVTKNVDMLQDAIHNCKKNGCNEDSELRDAEFLLQELVTSH